MFFEDGSFYLGRMYWRHLDRFLNLECLSLNEPWPITPKVAYIIHQHCAKVLGVSIPPMCLADEGYLVNNTWYVLYSLEHDDDQEVLARLLAPFTGLSVSDILVMYGITFPWHCSRSQEALDTDYQDSLLPSHDRLSGRYAHIA